MRESDYIAAGHEAPATGDLAAAKEAFEDSSGRGESREALDGLGRSLWWLRQVDEGIDARTRAYAAFRQAGRFGEGASIAVWLAHAAVVGRLSDRSRVELPARAKELLTEEGWLIVGDENAGESLAEPGRLDGFFYGASVLYCLPQSLAEQPSAAIGTVIRAETMVALADQAGFSKVEHLRIENDFGVSTV